MYIVLFCVAACIALVSGQSCLPYQLASRPDCMQAGVEGWTYWGSMQYKYFARRMSRQDANQYCKPFNEELCSGEGSGVYNFLSYLASFAADGEDRVAIRQAYNDACFRNGRWFWLGVKSVANGCLVYTDNQVSSLNTFSSRQVPASLVQGSECVAMNGDTGEMRIRPCSDKLAFVCKIQPNKH